MLGAGGVPTHKRKGRRIAPALSLIGRFFPLVYLVH